MMEEDQQQRFVCRFCNKSFWSGSALGGHMRGHIVSISAEKVEEIDNGDLDFELEGAKRGIKVSIASEIEPDDHGEDSYGLRGNPKKSWRVSDSKHGGWKKLGNFCEECGKGFSSLKALTIHMRLHMAKRRKEEIAVCKECGKEFESIKGLFGHMRCHPKRSRTFVECDYQIVSPIRKKRSRTRYNKVSSSSSCSDLSVPLVTACSETDEVKDVALCLMMLSRGLRSWDEFKLIVGSLGCTDSGNLEGQLLIESKGNPGNEGDVNFACDDDGEIRHMEARENLDCGVSVSKISTNLDSGAVNDGRKPEFEASVDEYSVGIKNEASSELDLKAQVGEDKEDQGLEKTNLMREVVLVDQDLKSNENSCNDSCLHVPVKPVPLRVFVRKNRFKCSACGMIFFSHQAVVDHEATHKTVDNCIQLTEEESGKKSNEASLLLNIEVDSKLEKLESNGISVEQVVSQRYACSICFKVFKSGPALGGHKRAHYNRRNESKDKDNLDQELPDYMHNLLGLNFPATLVADSMMDAGLKPCRWPGKTLECEPPVIFN